MASVVKAVAAKTKTIWNKDMLPLRLLATPEQRANISRFGRRQGPQQGRKDRPMVPGGIGFPMLQPGDVVSVSYKSGDGMPYTFTGILLALKRKKMMSPNSSITIRNIFDKVPIETQIAVYAAPMLRIRVMDQMRKAPKYRPAKLYYLRERLQRESIIVT